ncbi:MAG: hypothetical protein JXR05_03735 [Flavobacteriaceae bacterium]
MTKKFKEFALEYMSTEYKQDRSLSFDDFTPDRGDLDRAKKSLFVFDQIPFWHCVVQFFVFVRNHRYDLAEQIDLLHIDEITPEKIKGYNRVILIYQDPILPFFPEVYEKAKKIESYCDSFEIPMIFRPDSLNNTTKSVTGILWKKAGLPCARQFSISSVKDIDALKDLQYPVFLRYDAGHDSHGKIDTTLFYSREEIDTSLIEKYATPQKNLAGVVLTEFIDTQLSDGTYRKYRAYVAGKTVYNTSMGGAKDWYVHAQIIQSMEFFNEAYDFIQTEPTEAHKEIMIKANEVLGLDFSAIDYSFDKNGKLILWEANPNPGWSKWYHFNSQLKFRMIRLMASAFLPDPIPLIKNWK